MTEKLSSQKLQDNPSDMAKLFGEFASLFSETLDCSEDPNNPEIGFDLKGVSLQDCLAAKNKQLKYFKHVELSGFSCLETIADEAAGTGAIWLDIGNTGKFTEKFKVRGAFRFTIEDGVCSSYHTVYDSFNLLGDETMLAETPSSGVKVVAAMAFIGALGLVAGMKISQRKKNVLLEQEVIA
jgi:hypothetical protein